MSHFSKSSQKVTLPYRSSYLFGIVSIDTRISAKIEHYSHSPLFMNVWHMNEKRCGEKRVCSTLLSLRNMAIVF